MPGKVNPVIPEAVAMASADVIGNDASITIAAQSGSFQLNVMLPVIAYNLLKSINLMAGSMSVLSQKAIKSFRECLNCNPMDKLSDTYIERCTIMKKKNPKDWDGVWVMTSK